MTAILELITGIALVKPYYVHEEVLITAMMLLSIDS